MKAQSRTLALLSILALALALLAYEVQPTDMVATATMGAAATAPLSGPVTGEVEALSREIAAEGAVTAARCKVTARATILVRTLAKRAVKAKDRERALAHGTAHIQKRNRLIAAAVRR